MTASPARSSVLIIGSGFGGLGLAIRLKQAGIHDFTILERAAEVGGTWQANRYPGCACDIQSHLYSFSFEPNPEWSREFAPQGEILQYLKHCADKYGIRPHVRLDTEVTALRFDDARSIWVAETTRGTFEAKVVVSATGGLSRPSYPGIPGRETFGGMSLHTAAWDASKDLAGKRVGVIGTGASSIQIVPELARIASRLTVFQRSAAWVLPKPDGPISEARRDRFRRSGLARLRERLSLYWMLEARGLLFVKFPRVLERGEALALRYLERTVADPVLRRKLTPEYRMGCKRVLLSNDYYPALTRPNVDVVTENVTEIREGGIVTVDGREHALDAIVFATGFHVSDALPPIPMTGRRGVDLAKLWAGKAPETYLAGTLPDFPNLFMLNAPNTGLSHNSMVFMLESMITYVVDAVRTLRDEKLAQVSVKPEVMARYNEGLQKRFVGSIWASGCKSYYLHESGKNVAIWPGFTFEFRRRTRRFDVESYDVVREGAVQADRGPSRGGRGGAHGVWSDSFGK